MTYDLLDINAQNVSSFIPCIDDVTFTHSVFTQCFLPLRRLKNDAKSYDIKHGRVSLAIDAGRLLDPETGELVRQDVPYGSAARVVLAHIHNHIIRAGSLDEAVHIPMGESLRDFFRDYRLKISGQNGKQIVNQVNNIAAAHITLGMWSDNHAVQVDIPKMAKRIDFWWEKDEQQRSIWQPSMTLNPEYAEAIRARAVPVDMRVLVGLYEKPLAMDVFTWLSYRLPQIKNNKGVFIPYEGENGLHSVFGKGRKGTRQFKASFIEVLKEVHKWYPTARISAEDKGVRLYHSPSPIPAEHGLSKGRSLFFVGDNPVK